MYAYTILERKWGCERKDAENPNTVQIINALGYNKSEMEQ